jgi:hypothetical protein
MPTIPSLRQLDTHNGVFTYVIRSPGALVLDTAVVIDAAFKTSTPRW